MKMLSGLIQAWLQKPNKLRFMVVRIFLCLVGTLYAECTTITSQFDVLFPQTPFAQTLTACMQAFGVLQMLHDVDLPAQDRMLLVDICVGRLSKLEERVSYLVRAQTSVDQDDLAYLDALVTTMRAELDDVLKDQPTLRTPLERIMTLLEATPLGEVG